MKALLQKLIREEPGQGLTEYALIIGFAAVAVIAALVLFRGSIDAALRSSADEIASAR